MEEEKFLTSGDVAKLLNVHRNTLTNWDKTGRLKPHHISATGYKYYSLTQIQSFLPGKSDELLSMSVAISSKVDDSKTQSRAINAEQEKPLFRLYVDSGTGESYTNYYAMRSGKTNALAFVNNSKLFERITEMIGNQEILSDDDKYKFLERMHNVTVTLDGKYLDSINATIAKCVFWIQLAFTNNLGYDHPSDDVIENARYMKWNIDDYMQLCGLSDRKSAIANMRKMLDLLSHAEIQWQEEVVVRGNDGKPIYVGSYKDKNGKLKKKVKKMFQTYRGVFISTRGLKPVCGGFEYWINKEFATYLAHAGVIAVHEGIFKLNAKHNPSAITLAVKLLEYNGMNRGKPQANVISVKSLLNALNLIPNYESLTDVQIVQKDDGQKKQYEKHGNKGGWRSRILQPFESSFEKLIDCGIITTWHYRDCITPENYEQFENQYVQFELADGSLNLR